VLHGGVDKELRLRSIKFLSSLPFDGFAIGGSLGQNRPEMFELVDFMTNHMPMNKPNHLLGIGDVESINKCTTYGIDSFDSCYPTRAARHGYLFTKNGDVLIRATNSVHKHYPIDPDCQCHTCKNYTISYLHHLLKTSEPIFTTLTSIHNLYFMGEMMKDLREKIMRNEI